MLKVLKHPEPAVIIDNLVLINPWSQVSEEADGIRESLSQLRQSIPAQDSQQAAIDQLEKYISELMSKLVERSSSPSGKKSRRHVSLIRFVLLRTCSYMYMYIIQILVSRCLKQKVNG